MKPAAHWLSVQDRLSPAALAWNIENVFTQYPALFGVDTAAQREQWGAEFLWAATIVDTRSFSARFPGDSTTIVPFVDFFNHDNAGGGCGHSVPSADRMNEIISYQLSADREYQPASCRHHAVLLMNVVVCRDVIVMLLRQGEEVMISYTGRTGNSHCNHEMFKS